ncbi:MAG TPA: nucleotidyltransferase family protein [Chitinophagales bacterium]|nr:nucleotidyltransferase family protein [Chitinophagales bacterium]HRP39259.1 nucleotidyltransferase family protein [Chitinophagales bacterium]
MTKKAIIETIKAEKPYLQEKFGVEEIALFGSYARGEENTDSDVDILVKLKIKTLRNYIGIIDFLQEKLHAKVDLVTKHNRLSERFLRLVSKDIIYV